MIHSLKKRIYLQVGIAINMANYRLRIEHTQRSIKLFQTLHDKLMIILTTLVADIIISTKDITLVMKILFIGFVRQ